MPTGTPFDAELPPRITAVKPSLGSLAGGTDLTIEGTGFGSDPAALAIEVAGLPCAVSTITSPLYCRLAAKPAATAPARPTPTTGLGNGLASLPGERGARWQWAAGDRSNPKGSLLVPSFSVPTHCAAGCDDIAAGGTAMVVEGWFEAPVRARPATRPSSRRCDGARPAGGPPPLASASAGERHLPFVVKTGVASTLVWSGNATTAPRDPHASRRRCHRHHAARNRRALDRRGFGRRMDLRRAALYGRL